MKQKRFLGFLPVIGALMLSGAVHAQDRALNLGSEAGQFGETVGIALTLDSTDDVQGIVAVFVVLTYHYTLVDSPIYLLYVFFPWILKVH